MEEAYKQAIHLTIMLANYIKNQRKPNAKLISTYIDLCEEIRMWNGEFELKLENDMED